jgi:hypothetical protein
MGTRRDLQNCGKHRRLFAAHAEAKMPLHISKLNNDYESVTKRKSQYELKLCTAK